MSGRLRLFDSRRQKLVPFRPANRTATLYVCGITPYDTTHLGHAFTYTSFDVLVRYLEWRGIGVRYVQNVTDVDDDILRHARERGEDWLRLGNRWTRRFIDDLEALNVRPPDLYTRATDAIPQIIAMIQVLLERGLAYARGGSVYYRSAGTAFGSLSHLPAGEWLRVASDRGNDPADPNKEQPLDSVLWQAAAPGEPAWPSPWGPGRPGWHIECASMATHYLGPCVDIHGGGADLAFPHHESEAAQAAAYTGVRPFARYWLHTAMVHFQGQKMSKSLGNLVMVCHLLADHAPDALRLYLASHRYRDSWGYDPAGLQRLAAIAGRWQAAAAREGAAAPPEAARRARSQFAAAMDDDLDTPRALGALAALAEAILAAPARSGCAGVAQETLRELAGVLGLRLGQSGPEPRVVAGWAAHKARFPVLTLGQGP